jgi:pilus assembly protein Flp/PilA
MLRRARTALTRIWAREEGLTTVEYAVAGTLITLAVIAAFTGLGTAVTNNIMAIVGVL